MIIPVRCFSCGKVVASDYRKFVSRITEVQESGKEVNASVISKTMDDLGIERYCCRRMIISHADLIDEVLPFS